MLVYVILTLVLQRLQGIPGLFHLRWSFRKNDYEFSDWKNKDV